jgi:hypothetical protein
MQLAPVEVTVLLTTYYQCGSSANILLLKFYLSPQSMNYQQQFDTLWPPRRRIARLNDDPAVALFRRTCRLSARKHFVSAVACRVLTWTCPGTNPLSFQQFPVWARWHCFGASRARGATSIPYQRTHIWARHPRQRPHTCVPRSRSNTLPHALLRRPPCGTPRSLL